MKRLLLCLALLLFGAIPAFAQSTTVSGTVTDAGAQSWNNGTFSFTFVPSAGTPFPSYTWTGGTLNPTINGTLSASGTYSVSIPSNTAITPGGSQWNVQFCPQATSQCFSVKNTSITGGTQTINATPPAILINLNSTAPPVSAYSTTEVTGAVIGSQFYLLGTGLQVCSAVSGNSCTTWASSSGSGNGVGAGAAPAYATFFGSNCPVANTGGCIFTSANTTQYVGCSYASGLPTITCSASVLPNSTTALVGQRAYAYRTCNAFTTTLDTDADTEAFTTSAQLTVLSETATTLVLSGNAQFSASNTANVGACVKVGTPDDTGAAALDTYLQTLTYCPYVVLSAAGYMYTTPPQHMVRQYTPCNNLGSTLNTPSNNNQGNIYYASGYHLEGRGRGNTVINITPGFPETGLCTNGPQSDACFVRQLEAEWEGMSFDGGQNATGGAPSSVRALIGVWGPGALQQIYASNWGPGQSSLRTICFQIQGQEQLNQVDDSGCGSIAYQFSATSAVTGFQVTGENSAYEIDIEAPNAAGVPNLVLYDSHLFTPQSPNSGVTASPPYAAILNKGGSLILYRPDISCTTSFAQEVGIWNTVAGGTIKIRDGNFRCSSGATTNGSILLSASATVDIAHTTLTANSSGFTYKDVTGSILRNETPLDNVWGTAAQFSLSGTAIAPPAESGTVSCSTSAATITYKGTYLFNPFVVIQDQTTAGVVTQTSISTTQKVVGCPGASDVLLYTVTPNPV
jgi:hypothetical protein